MKDVDVRILSFSLRDVRVWLYEKLDRILYHLGAAAFCDKDNIYFCQDRVWTFTEIDDCELVEKVLEHEILHQVLWGLDLKDESFAFDNVFFLNLIVPGDLFQG
jgi:hypothetical protein